MTGATRVGRILKGRSLAELGDRARQAGLAAMERAGLSRDARTIEGGEWRRELRDENGKTFPSLESAMSAVRLRLPGRFFAGAEDAAATVRAIRAFAPASESLSMARAMAAAEGRLWLLGYRGIDYGDRPDWHLDPVLGRRAPLAHWSEVPYLDPAVVGDHKLVWELNRHQWLVHLAKAWHFTGDARWADLALGHVDAWIEANPPKRGINWASSLEIAFRGIAWLWILALLRECPALTEARFARMIRILAIGGRHVERNLSTWFSPNTHLTGEALGLLYLGCALPELRDAARWRRLGLEVLAERMPEHVRRDGTYIEQSTHYARYTVDFLVHAICLARRGGLEVPASLADALRRGATFLRHACRPDGTLPLIGDDDGGRVLFLDARPPDEAGPTLAAAAILAGDASLALASPSPSEEVAWLLGPAALEAAARAPVPPPAGGSRHFDAGGVATLRTGWAKGDSLAVFDCGSHGMGNGGHAHADLGSVDLTVRGKTVIADPGTYSYLPGEGARDDFRAAAAHAVALVDGAGSAEPGGAFSWKRVPRVTASAAHLSARLDFVAFRHDGFEFLADPVSHTRALARVRDDYWLVVDAFRSAGAHEVTISFPLSPGLHVRESGPVVVVHGERGDIARFAISAPGGSWNSLPAWSSNAYGRREAAHRLVYRASFSGDFVVATLVRACDGNPDPEIVACREGGATIARISRADGGRDVLAFDCASLSHLAFNDRPLELARPGEAPPCSPRETS